MNGRKAKRIRRQIAKSHPLGLAKPFIGDNDQRINPQRQEKKRIIRAAKENA